MSLAEFCEKDSKTLEKFIENLFDKYKDLQKNTETNFEEKIEDIDSQIKTIDE